MVSIGKFKDAVDWILTSEYVESNVVGIWNFNITGEDYLFLNELFKKHDSIEPVFLFINVNLVLKDLNIWNYQVWRK